MPNFIQDLLAQEPWEWAVYVGFVVFWTVMTLWIRQGVLTFTRE